MTAEATDSIDYLAELEQAKKQYEQYLEISRICQLPIFQPAPEPQYAPPSFENPLTTNKIKTPPGAFIIG